ncbi:50S ribosomal protein L19 [Candidatus Riesia pediculicola]|uniref:Large ribosomal subunit protein bL19 n=1 Tax=Riesia pediculicola (strain USDA) TaxID=515618 RepID=D4G7L7_RIEPU|nr:50S ribosomal protein L19 [Candidatus Riesia pediculicola]ADD79536.1 ribosomal protein L19 [Candidatus Riesia pediculicola USDA]ARC53593.1 50S ribosomal protein L19 [Candidatus Riesia pediculicola]ARC54514.1 50S ribosomal protein L19 [Candidatus Riesia pediculicola]QOJ86246.1 50S ribosomal protein L19 [Candidatus Riesia pediculicola]
MKNIIIQEIENSQIKKNVTICKSGDTVEVLSWIKENDKKRLQSFEGIVISIKNKGLQSSYTIRRVSQSEGTERMFQIHSPIVEKIIIKRLGDVRKSKLYYLRKKRGRSARIKEKIHKKKI